MGFLAKIDRIAGDFAGGLQGGLQFGAQIGQMRQESQRYAAQERRYASQADEQQKANIRQQATNGDRNALNAAQRYGQEFVNEIQATLARPGEQTRANLAGGEAKLQALMAAGTPTDPQGRAQTAEALSNMAGSLAEQRGQARAMGQLTPPATPPPMRGAPGPAGTLPTPGAAAGIGAPTPKPAMPSRTGPMMPEVMNKIDPIAAATSRAAGIRFVDSTRSNILSTALTADSQTLWDQLDDLKTAYQQEGRKPEEAEALTRTLKQHITEIRDEAALDALMKAEGDAEATREIIGRFGTLNPWVVSIGEARVRKEALSRQGQMNQLRSQAFEQYENQMKLAMYMAQSGDATAAREFLNGAVSSIEGTSPDIAARVYQNGEAMVRAWTPMNPAEIAATIRKNELNDPNWFHIAAELAERKYRIPKKVETLTGKSTFESAEGYAQFVRLETGQEAPAPPDPQRESRAILEQYNIETPMEKKRLVVKLNSRAAQMDAGEFDIAVQPFIEAGWSVEGRRLIPPQTPGLMDMLSSRLPQSVPMGMPPFLPGAVAPTPQTP